MHLTVTLTGSLAERTVREIARRYAQCTIQSTLDGRHMWNAPWWNGVGTGKPDFKRWSKKIEAERRECQAALRLLIGDELPPVEIPVWRLLAYPNNGEKSPAYSPSIVRDISNAYSGQVLALVTEKQKEAA